ncbi:MAG TPA: SprT family zinc-dependent metalloprotease [Burkholderiaceae bacterium]|nr:SprT family zinc-dependent metalloprotease [Burkholderiaceae bacterium]
MAKSNAARRGAGHSNGRAAAPQALHSTQLSFAFDAPAAIVTSPPRTRGGPDRRILLSGDACEYRLRRARRRTIGFQIDDRGLTVSAPRWVSLRDIEAAILEKERWIRSRLEQWRQWRAKRRLAQVHFADGGKLPFLGSEITLRLRADLRSSALTKGPQGDELCLALPPQAAEAQVRDAVQTWLKERAQQVLEERLRELSARNGVRYSSWALSSARSQWGSCGADGRIRLNWRLVHFALPVIDYVVAHELAHLKELNHGPEFWLQVGRLLPGFEAARDHIRNEDLSTLPL